MLIITVSTSVGLLLDLSIVIFLQEFATLTLIDVVTMFVIIVVVDASIKSSIGKFYEKTLIANSLMYLLEILN
ncbi:MAG: hypothetical protein ACR5KW_01820 [Wolbachia sp.]